MKTRALAPALGLAAMPLALLAACNEEPVVEGGNDNRSATGEVLEGSISDAMLPIDRVQSQPPLAEEDPEASGDEPSAGPATPTPADVPAE